MDKRIEIKESGSFGDNVSKPRNMAPFPLSRGVAKFSVRKFCRGVLHFYLGQKAALRLASGKNTPLPPLKRGTGAQNTLQLLLSPQGLFSRNNNTKAPAVVVMLLLAAMLLTGLSSCFKEKPLTPPSNAGIGQTNTINMGPYYGDQFFYSLATNKIVSSNSRLAYDLMFDDNPNTFNIWLNSSNFSCVCATGQYNLDSVTFRDTVGHNFIYEKGSYNPDSNSIGQWWQAHVNNQSVPSQGQVYIINLGVDSLGHGLGFEKMFVADCSDEIYTIYFEDMNNSGTQRFSIQKDGGYNYNYLYLSFKNGVVNIEPNRNLWDLEFTHYSTLLYYDLTIRPYPFPYAVTGVLSNPSRVSAYLYPDTLTNFDSIKINNFNPGLLQTNCDAIGYDWKRYDGTYTVLSYYTYFIQTGSSSIYKLHFVGYYNKGNDGYPAFEYFPL